MERYLTAQTDAGLSDEALRQALLDMLDARGPLHRVLIIPPDFTRYHSNAGFLTNVCYHALTARGCAVDVLPALGTHDPVSREQAAVMFGDVPYEALLPHNWRTDVVKLGEVPAAYLEQITDGLWHEAVDVEISRRVMDTRYDLILSFGQVVPHEVVGMSNHAKNLFVGVGGHDMINKSHMVGAVYGLERMMGHDHTPVRKIFDYAFERFLRDRPIVFGLTVTTAPEGRIRTHGLFLGEDRRCFEAAVALAQQKNIDFVDRGIRTCVAYLNPDEFKSTWLANKAVYRTRMAIADGGRLIVLAPGVAKFGEDPLADALIRKYGYRGRLHTLSLLEQPECADLRANLSAAAHLIHGSPDGRFTITYAVKAISQEEIVSVGYDAADYDTLAKRYDPARLAPGYNTLPDGEEVYFIPNPALGLWIDREKF